VDPELWYFIYNVINSVPTPPRDNAHTKSLLEDMIQFYGLTVDTQKVITRLHSIFAELWQAECTRDLVLLDKLGEGCYGRVYLIEQNGTRMAIKIQHHLPIIDSLALFQNEIKFQKLAHQQNIAPEILASCSSPANYISKKRLAELKAEYMQNEKIQSYARTHPSVAQSAPDGTIHFIIMEIVDETLVKWLMEKRSPAEIQEVSRRIKTIIETVSNLGIIHGDLHVQNLAFMKTQLVAIDYGYSSNVSSSFTKQEGMELDALKVISSLRNVHEKGFVESDVCYGTRHRTIFRIDEENYQHLEASLLQDLLPFIGTTADIRKRDERATDKYIETFLN
jgi:tRNA A-37 threonylcarbamoyl transferase component Bud32